MQLVLSVAAPLLIHLMISVCVAEGMYAVFGPGVDAALATAVTALLVIPIGVWMYRKDEMRGYHTTSEAKRHPEQTEQERMVSGNGPKDWQRVHDRIQPVLRPVLCFFAGGIVNLVWSGALSTLQIQEYFSNEVQETLLAGQIAVQIAGLGFLVPVAEELVFRGLTYSRMKTILSVRQSMAGSALLFAVYHGNVIQMVFAFPLAWILAWLYERRGRLTEPIAFHMGVNLAAVFAGLIR